ncbi:DNA-binding protein [Streptomyces sp. NPDC002537]
MSGALFLGGEGLAKAVQRDREVHEWIAAARAADLPVVTSAATLLRDAGLHGHKYAIDAMLCATALAHLGRVTILTSGTEDIQALTAGHPRVVVEKI